MHDFEGVKFTQDMRCPGCKVLLARRFTFSFAFYLDGNPVENYGIGGLSWDEMQATYEIRCEACNARLEFSTPEDASQYMLARDARAIGPPVWKLT